jgi:hypothetical protein
MIYVEKTLIIGWNVEFIAKPRELFRARSVEFSWNLSLVSSEDIRVSSWIILCNDDNIPSLRENRHCICGNAIFVVKLLKFALLVLIMYPMGR